MWPVCPPNTSARSSRGITLVEMLICAGLMSIIMLGTYSMLALSLRQSRKVEDSVTAFQRAFAILRQLELDMVTADRFTLQTEIDALAFNSASTGRPVEIEPNGDIVWQKQVVYLREPVEQRLFRYEQDLDTPGTVAPPFTLPLVPFAPGGWRTEVLSERVSAFVVEGGATLEVVFTVEGLKPIPISGEAPDYDSIQVRQRLNIGLQF